MFVFLTFFIGYFAKALTPEQLLQTAFADSVYVAEELREASSRNPFRNIEGFTSIERKKGRSELEVGVKFNFRSWSEWHWREGGFSSALDHKTLILALALRERYKVMVSYFLSPIKIELLNSAQKFSESYLRAQALSLRAGLSNAKSLLEAQSKLYDFKKVALELIQEKELTKQKIKIWIPSWDEKDIQSFEFISMQDILNRISGAGNVSDSLSSKMFEQEAVKIGRELEIVRGRANQWIKGVEVSQVQKADEWGYKLQLNIQLPGLGADDLSQGKQNELLFKKLNIEKEREQAKARATFLKKHIIAQIELYKILEENLEESLKAKSNTPVMAIENQMLQATNRFTLVRMKHEIFLLFVDYLLESELLLKDPLVNQIGQNKKVGGY